MACIADSLGKLLRQYPEDILCFVGSSHSFDIFHSYAYWIQAATQVRQSSTLITRGLATGEIGKKHGRTIFLREMITGAILGISLGAFAYLRAYLMQGDPMIGFAVGISLFVVLLVSNLVGALLPLLAMKLKCDPAVMAGLFLQLL